MIRILAADIGATNARFALFQASPDDERIPVLTLERELWLRGADFPTFGDVLRVLSGKGAAGPEAFLPRGTAPDIAIFAPAGPIVGPKGQERCRISNLPWLVAAEEIRNVLGISRIALINDFVAQAYACLIPDAIDALPILPGAAMPGAPLAVVGAGTGLGQALILPGKHPEQSRAESSRTQLLQRLSLATILPSEAGHAEFPFVGERESSYAAFAAKRAGKSRLVGDDIVSGSGLAHVFAFLTGKDLPPTEASAQAAEQPEVLEWFALFYGRACRNYVLNTLALGGLYVTGGMALRLPVLTHPAFAEEFHTSAVQRPLLEKIPVWHMHNPQAGLWGAALYGLLRAAQG